VNEVAVVGVPDAVMGECIKAFVTLAPGWTLSEQEMLRHCAAALEDILIPRTIEIVPTLPRTDTGKIARRALEAN
jgi:acyl-coenzyme A synthetase/AMP-(fatty) acid ligase